MLVRVADNRDRFATFAPYVASIDDRGVVAFQATLRAGGAGVFTSDGLAIAAPARSHPDIEGGALCFYADDALVLVRDGVPSTIATGRIGPLGPTMCNGRVAFRADRSSGEPAVFLWDDGRVEEIARGGPFHGLPIVTGDGLVVYRSGDRLCRDGETLAQGALNAFPCATPRGRVAFVRDGGGDERFASVRGLLVNDAGAEVRIATPHGGRLGVYAPERILGLGDPFEGSTITDFALNPVSINERGQLAIRVTLASGAEHVLRFDPEG